MLPPELLTIILECLVAPGDMRYTNKIDLQSANLTCRTLYNTSSELLFRILLVSFTLRWELPVPRTQPLEWEQPRALVIQHAAPAIRTAVKNVKLRMRAISRA